jgi:hypothetical protein
LVTKEQQPKAREREKETQRRKEAKSRERSRSTFDTFWSVYEPLKPGGGKGLTYDQCEKHSKKEEALEKLKGGAKFDDVAREFSEDKARAGMSNAVRDHELC